MIDLIVKGCCERCDYIDLQLYKVVEHSYFRDRNVYTLRCNHQEICAALKAEACSIAQQDPKD